MIKAALEYIVGLNKPEILEIGNQTYSDKSLRRVSYNPKASPVELSTLTSLVEYIKSGIDSMPEKMLIHVVSPTRVQLTSPLDEDRVRECLIAVEASIPYFRYGQYMGHENFLIALQSQFIPGEDRELLLKFAGTVENGTVAQYGDDGVTQKATIKTGIASKGEAIVPSPVKLRPFRTFVEVEQPESAFIFRMRQNERDGVECALFEADGGAWKNAAMKNIKEYLQYELVEFPQFTVIS
ncbi:MAG TPA: hypothetical protein IAB61_01760 [Candidatus Merdisoma merdipullorum]|nr:hypothetical protein [Candidatus Merdisoma merdipullorum]